MNNPFKKAVTSAVVASTIAWSIGLSALVAPLASHAAVTAGTLVKASLPAVYYVGSDMKRYVFPNEKTYKTWYSDFSGVQTITDAELASLAIGGNVTYKPGVMMVKITTSPKVYVVDAHGVLRGIASEAVASALYGSNWNQQIHDVPDAFFTNYTTGSDVNSASDFNRASVTSAATSINGDKNLVEGTNSSVSVMLSSGQPAGGTLPKNATGVNVVKFDVKNSGGSEVTINQVTVKRSGPGSPSDFDSIYVYNGSTRLTTGRSINSSSNEATFGGLNVKLAAGATANMWIAVDVAEDGTAVTGNVSSFSVTSVLIGAAGATGTPVSGPSFTLAGVEVGEVSIEETGGALNDVKAGGMNQKLGAFRIEAPSNEDADFSSIALTLNGGNRADISNLTLKQNGVTLATAASVTDKDLAVFTLTTPMFLEKGASRSFEIYGDIAAGADSGDAIQLYLDEETDLRLVGRTYGYGNPVDNGLTASDALSAEIISGKLTVTFNGPASHDISVNGNDQELLNFTVAAATNLEVRETKLTIDVQGADHDDTLEDIKIIDTANGGVVAGPKDGTASVTGPQVYTFNESWTVNAGSSKTFKVTADILDDEDLEDVTVKVSLGDGSGLFTLGKLKNLDNTSSSFTSDDLVPSTMISGNANTIVINTVEVIAASSPVAQTYIQGSQNSLLAGFTFRAGDAGAVRINSFTVDGGVGEVVANPINWGGTDGAAKLNNIVQTVKLWNGSTQIGETEAPNNAGDVTFDNLNLTIPAGGDLSLTLSGSIASSVASVNANDDRVAFRIDSNSVDATDADGDSLTVAGAFATAPAMTISTAGTVTVTRAPSDTESEAGIVVGGSTEATLAKFKFNATREELKLSKARFTIPDAAGVQSIDLYDGSTKLGTASVTGSGTGAAEFSGLNFTIPKDGSKTLTVKGTLPLVSSSSVATDQDVTVTLDNTKLEVRGTSAGSSTVLTNASVLAAPVAGFAKSLRKTKPTVAIVSLPSTSGLATGDYTVSRFTISADAKGDVAFQTLRFEYSSTDGAPTCTGAESSLRPVGNEVLEGSCTVGAGVIDIELDSEEVVAAGTSRTYDLRMHVAATGDSSFTANLESDAFGWSDISAAGHDSTGMTGSDWFSNGQYVKSLPLDSQTIND